MTRISIIGEWFSQLRKERGIPSGQSLTDQEMVKWLADKEVKRREEEFLKINEQIFPGETNACKEIPLEGSELSEPRLVIVGEENIQTLMLAVTELEQNVQKSFGVDKIGVGVLEKENQNQVSSSVEKLVKEMIKTIPLEERRGMVDYWLKRSIKALSDKS